MFYRDKNLLWEFNHENEQNLRSLGTGEPCPGNPTALNSRTVSKPLNLLAIPSASIGQP